MRLVTLATYSLAGISASRRLLRSCPSAGGRWHLPPPARSAHWPVSSGRNHEEPGRRAPRGVPRGDRYGPRTGPARAVRAARPPPDPVQRVRAARAAAAVVVAVGVGLVVPKLLSAPGRPATPAAIPAAPGTTPPFMTGQHAYRMDAGMVAAMTPGRAFRRAPRAPPEALAGQARTGQVRPGRAALQPDQVSRPRSRRRSPAAEQMDTAAVEFEEFLSRSVCQLVTSVGRPPRR